LSGWGVLHWSWIKLDDNVRVLSGWNVLDRHWPEPGINLWGLLCWQVLDQHNHALHFLRGRDVLDRDRTKLRCCVRDLPGWHVLDWCWRHHAHYMPNMLKLLDWAVCLDQLLVFRKYYVRDLLKPAHEWQCKPVLLFWRGIQREFVVPLLLQPRIFL
jgi:hypothetical protein